MEKPEIIEKLKSLLNDRFSIDREILNENSRLGDLGLDSMHLVDIMLDIESDLDFSFEKVELPANPSLGEIGDAIHKSAG